jgi:hypothetical protein
MSVSLRPLNVSDAIQRGLEYLQEHQLPNGEFCSYISGDDAMQGWVRPESTTWTTALISHCLFHARHPVSTRIQDLSLGFLGGQIDHGVWNHFTKYHLYRDAMPLDVDTTALVSALYRDRNLEWPSPSNVPLLLANRNKAGLFYTWFILRWKWVANWTYWRIVCTELLHPLKGFLFWHTTEANRNDVDGGINANVLYYLGEREETRPVIELLIKIIGEKREGECDAWYVDPMVIHYFCSRNYSLGIKALEVIKKPVVERILAVAKPDGMIGKSIVETALAVSSLLNFNHTCPEIGLAVDFLLRSQNESGNWPRWVFYYGGPKRLSTWGSEELTTALCLEALSRQASSRNYVPA